MAFRPLANAAEPVAVGAANVVGVAANAQPIPGLGAGPGDWRKIGGKARLDLRSKLAEPLKFFLLRFADELVSGFAASIRHADATPDLH